MTKKRYLLGMLLLLLLSSQLIAAQTFPQLEQLVSQSRYQQAWVKAQSLVKTHEGDPRFDY